MKKTILYILILAILFSAGCASNQPTETTTSTVAQTTTTSNLATTASTTTTIPDTIPSTSTTTSTVQTTTSTQQATTTTPLVGKTVNIDIISFAYKPNALTLNIGDNVVWTNKDSAPHTVTSQSGSELDSPTLSRGQTYSHTFQTAGTFPYYCTLHPSMKAKIIVE